MRFCHSADESREVAARLPQEERCLLLPGGLARPACPTSTWSNSSAASRPFSISVVFKVDVGAFMGTLNDRQRKMAVDLAGGMTTTEAARSMA